MSDEKKPFTVTDRRHFTQEGASREEEPVPASTPAPETPPDLGGPTAVDLDDDAMDQELGPAPVPADLAGLVVSLAAQATMLLGLAPGGEGLDLDGARGVISLIEMLQDKTRGNRTTDEDQLLEDVLYQLRMAYVMRTRSAS